MATRDFSDKQEKQVSKALGGVKIANSGATTFSKGDVAVGGFIIECKTKTSECKSFCISKDWLDTIEKERIEMGKTACALAFSFDAGESSYYVINERLMKRLVYLINSED